MQIRKSAFSFLEMMIVIAIIGGLMGMLFVNLVGSGDQAKIDTTKNSIIVVEQSLKKWKVQYGGYPTSDEGLEYMVEKGAFHEVPKDAWGFPLNYEDSPNGNKPFTIWSLGEGNQEGGEGAKADIYNYDENQ